MSDAVVRLRKAAVERAVRGAGKSSAEMRRAAFDNANVPAAAAALVDKIARTHGRDAFASTKRRVATSTGLSARTV